MLSAENDHIASAALDQLEDSMEMASNSSDSDSDGKDQIPSKKGEKVPALKLAAKK
jgi:hypothetical protein